MEAGVVVFRIYEIKEEYQDEGNYTGWWHRNALISTHQGYKQASSACGNGANDIQSNKAAYLGRTHRYSDCDKSRTYG